MADQREEILSGIKNSQEFAKKLRRLTPDDQLRARSARTSRERAEVFSKYNIPYEYEKDEQAWRDYLRYGHVPNPREPEKEAEKAEEKRGHPHVPLPHPKEKAPKNFEELEKMAEKHADQKEKEWQKKPDYTKAMDATHAWAIAKQDFFDKFAMENPKIADKWIKESEKRLEGLREKASKHTDQKSKDYEKVANEYSRTMSRHTHLKTALGRRDQILVAKKNKKEAPDFSWKPPVASSPTPTVSTIPIRVTVSQPAPSAPQTNRTSSKRRSLPFWRRGVPQANFPGIGSVVRPLSLLSRMSPLTIGIISSLLATTLAVFVIGGVVLGGTGGIPSDTNSDTPPIEGEPPPPGEPPPLGETPQCGTVWDSIKNDFSVSVFIEKTGNRYDNCSDLQEIYEAYQKASQSDKYRSLLNGTSTTMRIYPNEGCNAYTNSPFIDIYIKGCRDITITYLVLHETGHRLFRFMQPRFTKNKLNELVGKDPTCYDEGFLKTYFRRSGRNHGESFAEMAALYVMGGRERVAGAGRPISDFKSECDDSYDYIGGALYGGYEFR